MNSFFEAFINEKEPVYDIAYISAEGTECWRSPVANNANNSHSVTKFFIATAIGTLVDSGKLSVDSKVTSFFAKDMLPEKMSPEWNEVTVAQTMRHRTGIEKIPYNIDNDNDIGFIGDDFLKYVFSLEIAHEPGTFRQYSDEAYYLLGRIIHSVTGLTADEYLKKVVFEPLGFRQWAMAKCPKGFPICGGGFFARSDDLAKLGWAYANNGIYEGKRIVSKEWTEAAMENDYACTRFRDTDIFLKTGACGQIVAFSKQRPSGVSWHGYSTDNGKRNDRMLEAYCRLLDERFGKF
ncbi:MAG: beta-lactamase family protein [Clostridia bacterium]|nr:beta-lactamase family protein [Clostridia bacterium]